MSRKLDDFLEDGLNEELNELKADQGNLESSSNNDSNQKTKNNEHKKTKKSAEKSAGSPWLIFAVILCILQLFSSVIVSAMLMRLKMLPGPYVGVIVLVFAVLLLLDFFLLFWKDYRALKKGKKKSLLCRIAGTILAVIVIVGSLLATSVLDTLMSTMNLVTRMDSVEHVNISVYVKVDDSAQDIYDAADYQFGVNKAYDYEHSISTVEEMESKIGHPLDVTEYDTVFEMIDALYNDDVDAIILNRSFESIIEEVDGYQTFTYETRILHYETLDLEVEPVTVEREDGEFDITKDPFVVYLSGSDTRDDTLSRSRSDVNILVVVNPTTRQILLVNTPRDYFVEISIGGGERDKLAHCGLYGPQCSMDTLGALYGGIDVRYYAQINFTGFCKLIDSLGGIDVFVEEEIDPVYAKYMPFEQGDNRLNGEAALSLARARYCFADGDRARGRHQMAILKAVLQKITGSTTLIQNYGEIMGSLEGMFQTDTPSDDIAALIRLQLSDMSKGWTIVPVSVTGSDSFSKECFSWKGPSLYVMEPDMDTVNIAIEKIRKVLDGENLR